MLPSVAVILASLCAVARARFGGALGGYNLAQTTQYHIQTDEGPERYFRYQTDSGQYRKEKRLEDGTVVGTYGWVDAAGYLRLRDYIADNNGYRIVRTKKMWVGDEPIGRAVASAKYAPSQGGVGVANAILPNPTPSPYDVVYQPESVYVTPPSPFRGSPTPTSYLPPVTSYLPPVTSYLPPVSSTPRPYYPASTPAVSVVSSTPRPYYQSSTPAVSVVSSTPRPYYSSSSPASVSTTQRHYYSASSTSKPFVVLSSTPSPSYASSASAAVPDATPSPIRSEEASAYSSPSAPLHGSGRPHPFHRGYSGHLYDHSVPPRRGYISELPGTYDANSNSVIPEYDGIAVTHNGFRYYLPRQYQEEENLPGDRRAGSFGYVDPFGIRRVIYYNSSPGSGFQVRKNNRYVGFNSTPYDPRF